MSRLFLLLAVAAVLYILVKRAQGLPPHKRKAEYFKLALALAVIGVVGLTLAGKMHWIGAALTGLLVFARQMLPTLLRLFPMLASMRAQGKNRARQSTVTSEILRMNLDHDSGQLSGNVLKGAYKDWQLDEMDRQQLDELRQYCQGSDNDSALLLDSYLEQRFPGAADFDSQQAQPPNSVTGMSRKEALAVLGLADDADEPAIVAAHRKLMQKLHPDRGGNNYLAAKVNQAKDFLLS